MSKNVCTTYYVVYIKKKKIERFQNHMYLYMSTYLSI